MIAEKLVKYFDKPRNRIQCFLGALVIIPLLGGLKRNLDSLEQEISDKTILLGRLELTAQLLGRWWNGKRKNRPAKRTT